MASGTGQDERTDAGRGHRVDALGALGDDVEILEHVLHDLAQAEGDDGEVVAAQAHRRQTDQRAGSGADHRRRNQPGPEADLEGIDRAGQDRERIGAQGHEGGGAEIEQPGEARDHGQAEAENGEEQDRRDALGQRRARGKRLVE